MTAPLGISDVYPNLDTRSTTPQLMMPGLEWPNLVMYVGLIEQCLEGYALGSVGIAMRYEEGELCISATIPGFNLGRGITSDATCPKTDELPQVERILQRTVPPGLLVKALCIIYIPTQSPMDGGFRLRATDRGRPCLSKWQVTYREVPTALEGYGSEEVSARHAAWAVLPPGLRLKCVGTIKDHMSTLPCEEVEETP